MSFSNLCTAEIDGVVYTVRYRWNHWIPRLLRSGAITLSAATVRVARGNTGPIRTAPIVLSHELFHVAQIIRMGTSKFYWTIIKQIILHPFNKHARTIESDAYDAQQSILDGVHPTIKFISTPW